MIATDSARRTDENGYLHVEASALTKAAVNPYYGHEIPGFESLGLEPERIYQVLRPAEELEKAGATFNGLPILIRHEEDSAFDPQKALRVGTTGTSTVWDVPYIRNTIVFHDATAIALIDSKEQKELSAGYRYDPVIESGEFEGQPYELKMTNIRGNHIALVKSGRAGPDVVVADGSPFLRGIVMTVKKTGLAQAIAKVLKGKGLLAKDEAAAAEVIKDAMDAEDAEPTTDTEPAKDPATDQEPDADLGARIAKLEALVNKIAGAEEAEAAVITGDADEATDAADPAQKKPLAGDQALKKPKPVVMDAARITADVTAKITKQFRDKEEAAAAVMPLVGRVTTTTFDSAGDIYAFALKEKGYDPTTFPAEAHAGMCAVLANTRGPSLAVDSKPSGVLDGVDLDRYQQL
ncbi:MAG TPA: DUF2213 domain-containing protein [Pseudomonas sp.]|uniref:DUF2213 domain-containing protein n=1 Tax=Pseudomonas sp. TaxID=306 RepID=UPI002B95628B|nr:DUF2213 domain-containing protein [Pseudomonas sp.]HWH86170.1 DUF2213 domain-containing protein [Pseudomonas sp.]